MPETISPSRIHHLFDQWLERDAERPFLLLHGSALSYRLVNELTEAITRELLADGVRAGDRVLIVAENCPQHVALILACSRIGAWSCGVNSRMTVREVEGFVDRSDARLIYFTTGVSSASRQHAEYFSGEPSVVEGLHRTRTRSEAIEETGHDASMIASIIFTSGTTGSPKGVLVTHQGLLQFARISADCRRLTVNDCVYACLPMTHIFGLGTVLMTSLLTGGTLLMRSSFSPDDVFESLSLHGVTNLLGPSTLFVRLLEYLERKGLSRPHAPVLRYLYTGAGPLDQGLKNAVESTFGLPLHHGYGMSEYAGSLHVTRIEAPRDDVSAGSLVDGAELKVVGTDGVSLPAGERGEIWVRGVGLMPGYFRDSDSTRSAMRDGGWYATGDLGYLDPNGALFVVGRLKEMIVRSGFKVYPGEVEAVINSHSAIQQSAVVGRRLADGNEEVVAFVQYRPGKGVENSELLDHLRAQLAPYKVPSKIFSVDAFPVTNSGKILKRELLVRSV